MESSEIRSGIIKKKKLRRNTVVRKEKEKEKMETEDKDGKKNQR